MWVWGPEQVLKDEVASWVRSALSASDVDRFVFDLSERNEDELWDTLYHHSLMGGASRLVQVLHADLISQLHKLDEWLTLGRKSMPSTHLLMLADGEPISPTIKHPMATVVKCSIASPADRIRWAMEAGSLSEMTARTLLTHKNDSLDEVSNVCRKIRSVFPGATGVDLSQAALEALEDEKPSDFVDALLSGDKKRAIKSLEYTNSDSLFKTLSFIEYQLRQIDKLSDVLVKHPIGKKLEPVPGFTFIQVKNLLPLTRVYSSSKLTHCRQMLTLIDSYARQGVSEGLLEMLVAIW